MNTVGKIFEDQLLVQGSYYVELETSEDVSADDFQLQADGTKVPFELDRSGYDASLKILLTFQLEADYSRLSLFRSERLYGKILNLGLRQYSTPDPYRSEFFDYHYSLKDHIRQMDTILRFTEGSDALCLLFKTLRYEISANHAALTERLIRFEQLSIEKTEINK